VEAGTDVVTGSTRVPGATRVSVQAGGVEAQQVPAVTAFERTTDTARIAVEPSFGRALQVEVVISAGGLNRTFDIQADTMAVTLPGSLVELFDDRRVFEAGTYSLLTVAVTDTNYFDFVRSGSDPFTGRGFINHLTGGIGVFGSVASYTYELRVTGPQRQPWEGLYHISGTMGGVAIDATLDVYRQPGGDGVGFWAHLEGAWYNGTARTSVGGAYVSNSLHATVLEGPGNQNDPVGRRTYTLSGTPGVPGEPFPLRVSYFGGDSSVNATLTARRVPGP
jgi:hypothetical protein